MTIFNGIHIPSILWPVATWDEGLEGDTLMVSDIMLHCSKLQLSVIYHYDSDQFLQTADISPNGILSGDTLESVQALFLDIIYVMVWFYFYPFFRNIKTYKPTLSRTTDITCCIFCLYVVRKKNRVVIFTWTSHIQHLLHLLSQPPSCSHCCQIRWLSITDAFEKSTADVL